MIVLPQKMSFSLAQRNEAHAVSPRLSQYVIARIARKFPNKHASDALLFRKVALGVHRIGIVVRDDDVSRLRIDVRRRRARVPCSRVAVRADVFGSRFRKDAIVDELVVLDLVAVEARNVAVANLDASDAAVESAVRTRTVVERVPVDFANVLTSDTRAGFARVVVGAVDDGLTFGELSSDSFAFGSLACAQDGSFFRLLTFRLQEHSMTERHVRLLVQVSGDFAARHVARITLVNQTRCGRTRDVAIGGNAHQDLAGRHACSFPSLNSREHVGIRLLRVGACVGERSIRTRGRRSAPDIVVHDHDAVKYGRKGSNIGKWTSIAADEGLLSGRGRDAESGTEQFAKLLQERQEVCRVR